MCLASWKSRRSCAGSCERGGWKAVGRCSGTRGANVHAGVGLSVVVRWCGSVVVDVGFARRGGWAGGAVAVGTSGMTFIVVGCEVGMEVGGRNRSRRSVEENKITDMAI